MINNEAIKALVAKCDLRVVIADGWADVFPYAPYEEITHRFYSVVPVLDAYFISKDLEKPGRHSDRYALIRDRCPELCRIGRLRKFREAYRKLQQLSETVRYESYDPSESDIQKARSLQKKLVSMLRPVLAQRG